MKTLLIGALGIASALAGATATARAAVEQNANTEQCMHLMRIDHTRVVDDQNILFYTRNGNIFLNTLKHPAPGLGPNRPFMYRTSIGQLCRNDAVTVLEDWGFGFMPGGSGILGDFKSIDKDQAAQLTGGVQAEAKLEPAAGK